MNLDGFDLMLLAAVPPLLAMAVIAGRNLRRAPRMSKAGRPWGRPSVSLLIPARNEEANLRRTLATWRSSAWPDLEILILDDGSTDDTADIIDAAARLDARVRRLAGRPVPPGWLGKPWACAQLGEAARGDVLIFLDADVEIHPRAVAETVAAMQRRGAGAVTGLPRQILGSFAERAIVPLVMHGPIFASLPLDWSARDLRPSSVVANGQWLAVRRDAWAAIGGHRAVADRILDDMELGRALRAAGFRVVPLVAGDRLAVRMYDGARSVAAGFGKNLAGLVGWRFGPVALAAAVWTWLAITPWIGLALGRPTAAPAVLLLLAIAAFVARQGLAVGAGPLAWMPGLAFVPVLALVSWFRIRFGLARWKGRPLPRQDRPSSFVSPRSAIPGGPHVEFPL